MDKDIKFWNKVANKYSLQPIADMESYEHKLEKTREFFSKDTVALEIGCGTGSTALLHAPYVKHYMATDFSHEMINIAQKKLQNENIENITFERSSIFDVKVNQPVDAILALNVLHLTENIDKTIAHANSLLKHNGVFITSTVCLGDNLKVFKLIAPIGRLLRLMPLLKIFTKSQLKESLQKNDFRIIYEWQPEHKRMASVFIIAEKI